MNQKENNYQKLRVLGHKLYHYGNKGGQKRILIALYRNNNQMSQKKLMEYLDIKAGSLSEILSKMEEEGLIHRIPNPLKKKCLNIVVSELGQQKIHEYIVQRDELIQKLFSDFSEEECIEFGHYMDRLLTNFDGEEL